MKFDKTEKILISVCSFFVLLAFVCNIERIFKPKADNVGIIKINDVVEYDLKPNIRELSKKYEAYAELYESDKPTLVYSYIGKRTDRDLDRVFHETLKKKFKDANLDFRYLAYENWKDDSFKILLKNQNRTTDEGSCPFESDDVNNLDEIIDISHHCIINVCLIDVKRGKYSIISPDVDFVMETLNKYGK